MMRDSLKNLAEARGVHSDIQALMDSLGVVFLTEATYSDIVKAINRLGLERGKV